MKMVASLYFLSHLMLDLIGAIQIRSRAKGIKNRRKATFVDLNTIENAELI